MNRRLLVSLGLLTTGCRMIDSKPESTLLYDSLSKPTALTEVSVQPPLASQADPAGNRVTTAKASTGLKSLLTSKPTPVASAPKMPSAFASAHSTQAKPVVLPTTSAKKDASVQQAQAVINVPTTTPSSTPATTPMPMVMGTTSDPNGNAISTIDLANALSQAGIDNPTINLARERVQESLAQQTAARALLLPSLTAGLNYHYHTGPLQQSFGNILNVTSQSFYLGAGARTVAAESVAFPGVRMFAHLGDAVLEPRAASQRVTARTADAQAVQNQILLDVATAYLELVGADARVAALKQSEVEFTEIRTLTEAYARAGQGRFADANRAETNYELIHRERQEAEGELVSTSARLSGLLSLDPSNRLSPIPGPVAPVTLIDEQKPLEELVALALSTRPERVTRGAELGEAQTRVRQEKVRPWLPTIALGFSAGGFGGGSSLVSSYFGTFSGRTDFDAMAVWNYQNLGVGNRALVRQTTAKVGQAVAALFRTENEIQKEVSEAQADARAAKIQIDVALKSVEAAQEGLSEEMKRIRSQVGRPLEVLDSVKQLSESRLELIRAITAYNIAQFELWTAVGQTPVVK